MGKGGRGERGATLVEYAAALACVMIVCAAGYYHLGHKINETFCETIGGLGGYSLGQYNAVTHTCTIIFPPVGSDPPATEDIPF